MLQPGSAGNRRRAVPGRSRRERRKARTVTELAEGSGRSALLAPLGSSLEGARWVRSRPGSPGTIRGPEVSPGARGVARGLPGSTGGVPVKEPPPEKAAESRPAAADARRAQGGAPPGLSAPAHGSPRHVATNPLRRRSCDRAGCPCLQSDGASGTRRRRTVAGPNHSAACLA